MVGGSWQDKKKDLPGRPFFASRGWRYGGTRSTIFFDFKLSGGIEIYGEKLEKRRG